MKLILGGFRRFFGGQLKKGSLFISSSEYSTLITVRSSSVQLIVRHETNAVSILNYSSPEIQYISRVTQFSRYCTVCMPIVRPQKVEEDVERAHNKRDEEE